MKKKHSIIANHLKNMYVQKIKKWTICPACQCGKMSFDKSSDFWVCKNCNYQFSAKEFKKNQVHWFCEECNRHLNSQDCFDFDKSKHVCQNCGYENDISLDTVKGICIDCGAILSNAQKTLCPTCKKTRKQKAKEWLISAGKFVGGGIALVAGAACVISAVKDDLDSDHNNVDFVIDNDDQAEDIAETFEEDYDDEEDDSERLSADDAALIWAANGMDEDYMFGYSEDELRGNF